MQSWIPIKGINFAVNGPSWSISDEAFFYALFPFIVNIRGRTILLLFVALVAAATTWTITFPDWTLEKGGSVQLLTKNFDTPLTHWVFYVLPITRLIEFVAGIWLARLTGRAGTRHEIAAIALSLASVIAVPYAPPAFAASLIFIPASMLLVYVFSRSNGIVARGLSNPVLVLLGEASFALYMIHFPLGAYLGRSPLTALLAIGLSILVLKFFELPAQRWIIGMMSRTNHATRVAFSSSKTSGR